ncbi:uncharacterized protein BO66DRAFT_253415 [Aspergillus aculeatinus CBS 121060]|uniref:Uncharacterized protein n=1 Tax=Aspergillus aculeatinus CBS 121060 TaxID=1448322 RepID=A0ACD1HHQ6_9EURO|nr:hypothetical protein BO66DRAFT_253415 [Aspergillus aculeatinus CBS 121060]RAH73041.1 hypothetical protein BO66DRAFT_253415 [Aspergillus aculeatinus CBS 121060]
MPLGKPIPTFPGSSGHLPHGHDHHSVSDSLPISSQHDSCSAQIDPAQSRLFLDRIAKPQLPCNPPRILLCTKGAHYSYSYSYFEHVMQLTETNIADRASKRHTGKILKNYGPVSSKSGSPRASIWLPPLSARNLIYQTADWPQPRRRLPLLEPGAPDSRVLSASCHRRCERLLLSTVYGGQYTTLYRQEYQEEQHM